MDLPAFSAYSNVQPKVYYLGSTGDGLASLSDATFVVEAVKLPVHIQILSKECRVLRDMFSSRSELTVGTSLREPFKGYTTRSVATFLRFIYCTDDACAANFNKLAQDTTLVEVVRLAHQLDAPTLLTKLDTYLAGTVTSASLEVAVSWAELAEICHLDKLRMECIRQLAHKLAAMREPPQPPRRSSGSYITCSGCKSSYYPSSSRNSPCSNCGQVPTPDDSGKKQSAVEAVKDIASLQSLSHESLVALVAALVSGVRGRADHIPTAQHLAEAGALQAASAKQNSER